MPFSVFRDHQKKLLVVFGILAMVGFILSDTVTRMNRDGARREDTVVATLFDKPVKFSDLQEMNQERQVANQFMARASFQPNFFGGSTRPELLDALILKREADRLGIPGSSEFGREFIKANSFNMTAPYFESILAKIEPKVGGDRLLEIVASQARIYLARQELVVPLVTPLDVYRTFRDQTERASFKVVPFLVDSFVAKVPEPTDADLSALFEKYKDVLPDPNSPTPGFKIPRKVMLEFLSINANDVARKLQAKLTEEEIKSTYESRRTEFPLDPPVDKDRGGLPVDVFLGEPNLTPPRYQSLAERRDFIVDELAKEKAEEEIQDTFAKVREQVLDKFSDIYKDTIAQMVERGEKVDDSKLPKPEDLTEAANKFGLAREVTPKLELREAENYGRISSARTGSGRSSDGQKFAAAAFDPKNGLYDTFELNDILGDRYLVRKIVDEPARVADLKEVREQVVRAWKVEQARPLARKAAEEFAAKLKNEGAILKTLTVDGRPVIAIDSVTKMRPGFQIPPEFMDQMSMRRAPATPTKLFQIPEAGQPLLDALFALKAGEVAVEPDIPLTAYYAMTLDRREPVGYLALMGPGGSISAFRSETQQDVARKTYLAAIARLREQAGLKETAAGLESSKDESSGD